MFVVNPWPMILKPFCMHFVSFPKTLKYFWMAVLWHRHRSVPATPIQRTGARWGTRFARTCLWLIYAYALSILHPGNRDIQKRSRDPFVFWVQASQSRWNKADHFFFGSWTLSCKFMCQTEIFVSVPLHPRKKCTSKFQAPKLVPENFSVSSFYKSMSLKGSYHATPTCSSSLLDHRSCASVDIGWVRSDPKLRTWLQHLMFGSKTYCIWYRNIVLHHTYVIICIICI